MDNLRNAKVDCLDGCDYLNLSGANLTDAEIRGANLASAGFTAAQLISTASYKAYSLSGTELSGKNLAGVELAGQNLTNSRFVLSNLSGANLSGGDARGADFDNATLTGATKGNIIQTNGPIAGLHLSAVKSLVVRDYDGNSTASPPTGPLPIVVDQSMSMDANGTPWGLFFRNRRKT